MYFYTKKLPLSGWNYNKLTKNNDNLIMKRCRNSMETWTSHAGRNFHSCKTVGWNYQFKEYNAMQSKANPHILARFRLQISFHMSKFRFEFRPSQFNKTTIAHLDIKLN